MEGLGEMRCHLPSIQLLQYERHTKPPHREKGKITFQKSTHKEAPPRPPKKMNLRDGETTTKIKVVFLRGVRGMGVERRTVPRRSFSLETWWQLWKCKSIVRDFVVISEQKQPKEQVLGPDIRRTSTRISRRTSGGKSFSQALEILEKDKHFGAGVHDAFRRGRPWL